MRRKQKLEDHDRLKGFAVSFTTIAAYHFPGASA